MLSSLFFSMLVGATPCLVPPVRAAVVDPFRDPGCSYCPGNRGIEYEPPAGTAVTSAAAGTVSFAGSVANTLYVVVEHLDGYRTTYGRLASTSVRRGDMINSGHLIGVTTDRLFFGLRLRDDYLDPAPLLGRIVVRPYLVPLDGANRHAPPTATHVCR